MSGRAGRSRRAFVLIAVLVIVGSALLVATSLLFLIQAEAAAAAGQAASAQARALAWSGVQALMQRLDEQRDLILEGDTPQLDEEYILYETETRVGVVRLLPVGPDGGLIVPEAGRLDLHGVTADDLLATGLVDDATARAIVSDRDGGGLQSVAQLLQVEGVTPSMLYGPIEEIRLIDDAMFAETSLDDRVADRLGDDAPRGLADVVTVYSFEPPLQASGDLRINLNTEWSEELGERVADRFGEDAAQVLGGLFRAGATFESDADIVRNLRRLGVPLEDWAEPLDVFTTESGEFIFGRLDINAAPYEALLALPTIEPDTASQIVRVREDLGAQERSSILWPALEGILDQLQYEELAGRITTRSWVYRLRLAAGEMPAEDIDGALDNPVIYEAVIDLCAPTPRIAYLRDVTLLETTARIAAASAPEDDPFARDEMPSRDIDPETALDDASADELFGGDPEDPFEGATGAAAPVDSAGRAPALPDPTGAARGDDDPSGASSSGGAAAPSGSARQRIGRWRSG
ncbi:MAG: hypothetical protein ACYTGP_09045 [Planctomycetota bacterium]|jgi:DNA uptake protein ComE-like DNA-binding protein